MENASRWGGDSSSDDRSILEKALFSQTEKAKGVDREIAQLEIVNSNQRRCIDFISTRIEKLGADVANEDLVELLKNCRKILQHIVLLNEVYKRSIKVSFEEYKGEDLELLTDLQTIDSDDKIQKIDITSFNSKHPYDGEMLESLRKRQQELAVELDSSGDILKSAYPEEFTKIGEFFRNIENKVN